jgi:hypothetical protein
MSKWSHSLRLTEIRVARAYGMAPSTFDALSLEDRLEMLAEYNITNMMDAYDMRPRE